LACSPAFAADYFHLGGADNVRFVSATLFSNTDGSHDKLELASGKKLTFSGASTLAITSTRGAAPSSYVLVTAPGCITGTLPATLNLPSGWVATVTTENSATS
jgi:hypothetical protein